MESRTWSLHTFESELWKPHNNKKSLQAKVVPVGGVRKFEKPENKPG